VAQWLWYAAVPGMAVPGMAVPGFDGAGAYPFYQYLGRVPGNYLDYLDLTTGHTLVAVPGCLYAMLAVEGRAGLSVPPPDHCWLQLGVYFGVRVVYRDVLALVRARQVNVGLQAAMARGEAPGGA
jgi:hypothetical protein